MRAGRFLVSAGLALAAAAALVMIPAGVASAHEGREIGPYEVEVGFGDEPAYAGFQNSVAMFIHDHDSGDPVVDLGPTLDVQVEYQGQKMDSMTMEPNFEEGEFGTPGDYRAFFIPTRPGDYTFHFTGTVDGEKVDEKMTSSPKTFSSVVSLSDAAFPPVDAPTNEELASRIDQESTRSADAIDAATAATASAEDAASSAKTVGLIGVVLGALGIIAAIAALAVARKQG